MSKAKAGGRLVQGVHQWLTVLPFIGVGLILMAMFTIYPLIRNFQISVSEYNIIANQTGAFIGLKNYYRTFSDPKWWSALKNTLIYAAVTVPGQMLFGLLLAYFIHSATKGKTLFKVLVYLPVITSWVVASLVFKYIFASGNGGLVNYVLMSCRIIKEPISWLQHEATGTVVLCLFGIWKGTGWTMIIYLAALQGISKQIYEAGEMDGASRTQTLLKITVPLLKNTSLYLLTVLSIGAFSAYIHVMLITNGAPMGRTQEMMNYMYTTAFTSYDFSYASAQALIMGCIIFVLSFVQRRLSKETVN